VYQRAFLFVFVEIVSSIRRALHSLCSAIEERDPKTARAASPFFHDPPMRFGEWSPEDR
jgi:hypothetical protein